MSPIGNPQNLLIAIGSGIANPFVTFLTHLFVPTVLSCSPPMACCAWRSGSPSTAAAGARAGRPRRPALARLARLSLGLIGLMVFAKVALVWAGAPWELRLSWIALAGALPILVASPRGPSPQAPRLVDAAVLRRDVRPHGVRLADGFLQQSIDRLDLDLTQPGSILGVSVLLSQLVSNVPLVALYLPLLQHAGVSEAGFLTLAAAARLRAIC